MRSEIKSNHYDRNYYYTDNTTDMKYEESHFSKVALIAGVAALTGYGVKNGYFKRSISNMIKYASKYDTVVPAAVKSIRNNINNLPKDSKYTKSFLHKQSYKDIKFSDLKKKSSRARLYKNLESNINTFFDKSRFSQTKDLYKKIKKDIKKEAQNMKDIGDTELFKQINSIRKTFADMQADGIKGKKIGKAREQMHKDLLKNAVDSAETQSEMMKKYGYRHATIEDLYTINYADDTKNLKNATMTPKRNDVGYNESLQDKLLKLMQENEKNKYIKNKDFMKIKLDNSLLINEAGEIVDLRSFKESFNTITSSLANDFKIPIIGINPLKIFGLDTLGKESLNFSSVRKGSIQNPLFKKAGDAKVVEDMFFSMGSVYGFDEAGNITKIAENMKANRVHAGAKYVDRNLDSMRKMAGHKKVIYDEYGEADNVINRASSKFSKFFDIGFDDIDDYDMDDLGLNEKLNPNTWINKLTKWITRDSPISPHKGVERVRTYDEIFGNVKLGSTNKYEGGKDYFSVFTNNATKFTDLKDFDTDTWKNFFGQFIAGRGNMGDVTNYTSNMFYFFDRVNSSLSATGLGLSVDSLTSTQGIMKNLLLKRVLPIYAGYNIYQYGVHLTENGEDDEYGGKNNIQKQFAKGIAATDLSMHKLKDITHLTDVFKAAYDFIPGSDQITELPIIYQLGLDRTTEEQTNYYNTGKDPIRRGRYWDSGTSAFTGCLTPNSLLITDKGFKQVKNITLHDYLVSKDGLYHNIIANKIREANEVIYKLNTNFDPINNVWLTGNHNIYVIKNHFCTCNSEIRCVPNKNNNKCKNCKYKHYENYRTEWLPIENVNKKEYFATITIIRPTNKSSYINISNILKDNFIIDNLDVYSKIPNFKTNVDEDTFNILLKLSKTKHRHGELIPKLNIISDKTGLTVKQLRQKIDDIRKNNSRYYLHQRYGKITNDNIDLNKDFGYLLGYYAAEGCVIKNSIKITFNSNEHEYIDHTVKLFKDIFDVKATKIYHKTKKACTVNVNCHWLSYIFKKIIPGKANTHNKRISKTLLDYESKELWIGFLSGFIKGDGTQYKNKSSIVVSQSSYDMVKNVQNILLRHKIISSINKTFKKIKSKTYISYNLNIDGFFCNELEKIIDNKIDNSIVFNKDRISKYTHSKTGFFVNDNIVALTIKDIEIKDYDGPVYDFEVENEDSFISSYIMHNSKINYWKDNWFRSTMADVDFSDSKYGSREEFFENSPIPTPTHPFSPIKHFITDRYHYDEKHYDDRPYLETAPAFSNIPFAGSILSPTIGRLIKPVRHMHGDWQNESFFSNGIVNGINSINSNASLNIGLGDISSNNVNNYYTPYMYSTAGGNTSLVGVNTGNIELANSMIMSSSRLNKIASSSTDPQEIAQMEQSGELEYVDPTKVSSQSGVLFNSQELYNNANDFFGLYGFMASTVFGDANNTSIYRENPAYAYSSSRSFWNAEVGGLGGEANEIARRFLRKRLDDSQLVNPVRNTMPSYMPGPNYFTDFLHGDPFVKIPNGEMRLPGEGYERLWGLKPLDLKIGSSFIGKDVDEIVNHFLHYDEIEKGNGTDAIEEGNLLHKRIEKEFLNSGIAIRSEEYINDEKMGITGIYDLMVKDDESQFGLAIMDIKTVGQEKFNAILNDGPVKANMAQTNYYVRNSGLDRGHILYVNRDNPAQRKTFSFEYDQNLFIETMDNVKKAREIVYDKLDKNEISRGDLYDPIDRLRILADVAPYSSEYDSMNSYISSLSLDDSQKLQVREIRDRVSAQRNPKRLYEYKYKDIKTQTELVQVGTYLGDGTFTLLGSENIVKLAGVQLVDQEFEYAQEQMDEYLNSSLRTGSIVQLEYDQNPEKRTTSTGRINAIVHTGFGGDSLNKDLLLKGYAKENDSKNSIDIKVKTNLFERTVGSILESVAHLDTPIHTKFYKVRDAKEDYERSRVYGKEMI